jgi:hypothetical protein
VRGNPRGIAFVTAWLAAGAAALRDMIVDARVDSATTPVGYPMINVSDIECGEVRVTRDLFRSGLVSAQAKELRNLHAIPFIQLSVIVVKQIWPSPSRFYRFRGRSSLLSFNRGEQPCL